MKAFRQTGESSLKLTREAIVTRKTLRLHGFDLLLLTAKVHAFSVDERLRQRRSG